MSKNRKKFRSHTPKSECSGILAILVSSRIETKKIESWSEYSHKGGARYSVYLRLAQDLTWPEKTFWKPIEPRKCRALTSHHYEARRGTRSASSEPSYLTSKWEMLAFEGYLALQEFWLNSFCWKYPSLTGSSKKYLHQNKRLCVTAPQGTNNDNCNQEGRANF